MTAIEFLVEGINKLTGLNIAMDEPIIEQAKEMEKQQIYNAFYRGIQDEQLRFLFNYDRRTPEQYYNETFKIKKDD